MFPKCVFFITDEISQIKQKPLQQQWLFIFTETTFNHYLNGL